MADVTAERERAEEEMPAAARGALVGALRIMAAVFESQAELLNGHASELKARALALEESAGVQVGVPSDVRPIASLDQAEGLLAALVRGDREPTLRELADEAGWDVRDPEEVASAMRAMQFLVDGGFVEVSVADLDSDATYRATDKGLEEAGVEPRAEVPACGTTCGLGDTGPACTLPIGHEGYHSWHETRVG